MNKINIGRRRNLKGRRFRRLKVIMPAVKDKHGVKWLCRCDCGNQTIVTAAALVSGNTQSCGCAMIDFVRHRQSKMQKIVRRWKQQRGRHGECPKINLIDSFIAWTPAAFGEGYQNTAGRVAVIPWPDKWGWADTFQKTWGGCNQYVRELTFEQRSGALFGYFVTMTAHDGLDPVTVHNVFCNIREYRDGIPATTPTPDHLAEKFQREMDGF